MADYGCPHCGHTNSVFVQVPQKVYITYNIRAFGEDGEVQDAELGEVGHIEKPDTFDGESYDRPETPRFGCHNCGRRFDEPTDPDELEDTETGWDTV